MHHPPTNPRPAPPPRQTQRPRLRPTASFGSPAATPAPAPSPPDPAAAKAAIEVVDALQVQHFAAGRARLRGEAAKRRSREDAAAAIQRALVRAPRERGAAARVSDSARRIQRLARLRLRRRRAGSLLVRAWRGRVRARVATLERALVEAAGEGDLRAVAFLLRPPTAAAAIGGAKQPAGLGLAGAVGAGGADANATAGPERETALHAAAAARPFGKATPTAGNRAEDTAARAAPTAGGGGGRGSGGGDLPPDKDQRRSGGGRWLKGHGGGSSPDWVGVIQALVQAGATVEARDRRGFTPMMTAAAEGRRETVATLANLGAEVDAKETRGGRRTPLVLAAQTAVSLESWSNAVIFDRFAIALTQSFWCSCRPTFICVGRPIVA